MLCTSHTRSEALAVAAPRGSHSASAETPLPAFAPYDDFTVLRSQLLCGARLKQVRTLQDSIARFGLLTPIVAVRSAGRLVVVDGRKRLAAIRRLAFQGRLPRSLVRVPYLVAGDLAPDERRAPAVVCNRELYAAVLERFQGGQALDGIAADFHVSRQCVRDVLSLARLDEAVRRSFFERLIEFGAVRAYAAIPDRGVQRRVLRQVGPFGTPRQIAAAARGAPRPAAPRTLVAA